MAEYEIDNKRILEVGCGIALSSLVLGKREADITATDYHPEVEKFLSKNTDLNNMKDIPFKRTNWTDPISDLGLFDLIIGSDLIYEKEHSEDLSKFINQHCKEHCEVIIVDPGRAHSNLFKRKMIELNFTHRFVQVENEEPYTGKIHYYNR